MKIMLSGTREEPVFKVKLVQCDGFVRMVINDFNVLDVVSIDSESKPMLRLAQNSGAVICGVTRPFTVKELP
jgi:hypothetical protein